LVSGPLLIEAQAGAGGLPNGFVYVDKVIPGIAMDLRNASNINLIGLPLEGFEAPKAILTKEAALALRKVQEELRQYAVGLKVYEAYRPLRATNQLMKWAADESDVKMKMFFYPESTKKQLLDKGYLSAGSSYGRGSSVDVGLVFNMRNRDGILRTEDLDMGTPYGLLSEKSAASNLQLRSQQLVHRLLLKTVMEKNGFQPDPAKWWHFTLKNEPYPERQFDFPVK
jgi:D-alanyl-D-alanine dipeptidase